MPKSKIHLKRRKKHAKLRARRNRELQEQFKDPWKKAFKRRRRR